MPDPINVFEDLDREPGQPRMSDLWEWARDDYLAGEAADVVCERHKLSRSQFFERAKREGWRRCDRPRASAEPAYDLEAEAIAIEDALDRPPPSAYALYRHAWARMERAILMGRRVEAAGWTRLARDLRKLACEEAGGAIWRNVVKAEEARPDSPDSPIEETRLTASISPAQAGAHVGDVEENIDRAPQPAPVPDWAPACAGDTESGEAPDSPDSLAPPPLRGEGEVQPDSPDSDPAQSWARLAFGKQSRRQRRRAQAAGASPRDPDPLCIGA